MTVKMEKKIIIIILNLTPAAAIVKHFHGTQANVKLTEITI